MSTAVLDMARKRGGSRPGAGRPKGSGGGALGERFSVKVSVEFKAWLRDFAGKKGGEMADLFHAAMRHYAESEGFRAPPLR
jgi:hypothetical protein